MSFLLHTNVLSELRKRERCDPAVTRWYADVQEDEIFLSVLTIGEIRRGIELIRRRDARSARALNDWIEVVLADHSERILMVDQRIADEWGRLCVPDPLPPIDGLIAATARVHGLTLATRDVAAVERTGVKVVNPFSPAANAP